MRRRLGISMTMLVLAGCGSGKAPEELGPESLPAAASLAPYAGNGTFDVAVLVSSSLPHAPSREAIERMFTRAAQILSTWTGERMRLSDVVPGVRLADPRAAATAYVHARASNPPEGVLVLAPSRAIPAPEGFFAVATRDGFRSEFASPRVGADQVYVAVVDPDATYGRCGYDAAGLHVSDVSMIGECGTRLGTACVAQGDQYLCADAVSDLYAQPDELAAATIVHNFVHSFGLERDSAFDHYGSGPCVLRTGMTSAQATDSMEFQLHAGMCPDVFARFRRTP
jgi:hypothetical protein